MNASVQLWSPKLTLFAFQLRHDLASSSQKTIEDADNLWQKCEAISQDLGLIELTDILPKLQLQTNDNQNLTSSYYRQLLPQKAIYFNQVPQAKKLCLTGEFYPVQLHDTYAVDLTFRYANLTVDLAQISGLNPQQKLHPNFIKASLGQTLLFFAELRCKYDDLRSIADDCMQQLNLGELHYINDFIFLGSPVFEYNNSSQTCHLLIWLNCYSETTEKEEAGNYYDPLLKLLCYHHKILYVYEQSRYCDREARKLYSQLEGKVTALSNQFPNSETQLEIFKEWLKTASQVAFTYETHLRDLEVHQTTININAKNYAWRLTELESCSLLGDNLTAFQQFLEITKEQRQEQIAVDLAYLNPGKELFRQMLETIRGLVEIDQAQRDRAQSELDKERDRDLQILLTAIGAGLGMAGVTATAYPYYKEAKPEEHQLTPPFTSSQLHPITESILVSLGLGLLTFVLFCLPLVYFRSKKRSRSE